MKLLPFLSSALLVSTPAFAATLAVLPGTLIWAKVDLARLGNLPRLVTQIQSSGQLPP